MLMLNGIESNNQWNFLAIQILSDVSIEFTEYDNFSFGIFVIMILQILDDGRLHCACFLEIALDQLDSAVTYQTPDWSNRNIFQQHFRSWIVFLASDAFTTEGQRATPLVYRIRDVRKPLNE